MREIKFRIYDKERKLMEEVGAIDWASDGFPITVNTETNKYYRIENGEKHIELMQFTGLLDKSGKEIYEGDIIRKNYGVGAHDMECIVVWKNGSLGYKPNYSRSDGLDFTSFERVASWNQMEVIGNIHTTPELLK
jgi:uncharacterized phage protein (TIGR01671 family)